MTKGKRRRRTAVWDGLTVEERNERVATCRPGDPFAEALGLTDPDWANLDALGDGALEDARQIALDFAALIADGAERAVVLDVTPNGGDRGA